MAGYSRWRLAVSIIFNLVRFSSTLDELNRSLPILQKISWIPKMTPSQRFFLRGKWREKILYPFCEIPEEKVFIKKWKLALVHNIPKWPDAFKNLAANGATRVKCIWSFFLHFISFSCENLKKKKSALDLNV